MKITRNVEAAGKLTLLLIAAVLALLMADHAENLMIWLGL